MNEARIASTVEAGPMTGLDSTVDREDVDRFDRMAAQWWNPRGPFRPLHVMNPARIRYIRDSLAGHFGRSQASPGSPPLGSSGKLLDGLRILDIGCGGGLVAEPLARLGARVTGVDAAAGNVAVAAGHARQAGLSIDYRTGTAEALAAAGETFDAVLALEIIEHTADPNLFLRLCAGLVRPGGLLVLSTLNRTVKSLLLAKIGAEYVLRWIPRGTHDWRRFPTPNEITAGLRAQGLRVAGTSGMVYNPLTDEWTLSRDMDVNYLVSAAKDAMPA